MAGSTTGYPIPEGKEWFKNRLAALGGRINENRRAVQKVARSVLAGRLGLRGARTDDWNNAIENGWYWSPLSAANNPAGNIAVGHVMSYGPDGQYNRIAQEVWVPTSVIANTGSTWRRVGSSDQTGTSWTWYEWYKLSDETVEDAQLPSRIRAVSSVLGSTNLDTVVESGWYVQNANANATPARNYPTDQAGFLEVVRAGGFSGNDVGVMQRYTVYSTSAQQIWTRTWYGSWGSWRELTAPAWSKLTGVPSTFPPSSHTHPWSQITDVPGAVVPVGGDVDASAVPSAYPAGVSINTAGAGWPASIGTVMTVRQSGFRQFQHFYDRGAVARMWYRTAAGDAVWTAWREVYTDGTPRVTTADFITAGSGWSIVEAEAISYLGTAHVSVEFTRTGAAVTVPANGDVSSQTVGTLKAGWEAVGRNFPMSTALVGPVVAGRVWGSSFQLTAVAPGVTIPTGGAFTLAGSYLLV